MVYGSFQSLSPAGLLIDNVAIEPDRIVIAARWREAGLTREALNLGKLYGWNTFKYVDQALLNLVVRKKNVLTPFSRLYNFCRWPDMLRLEHKIVVNDLGLKAPLVSEGMAKILHWTGPIKPWHPQARAPELERHSAWSVTSSFFDVHSVCVRYNPMPMEPVRQAPLAPTGLASSAG
jgi:lipopolysaccharide biosynthesis glycosyltransferase